MVNANLVLGTERPVSVTADEFVCVTMDWWPQVSWKKHLFCIGLKDAFVLNWVRGSPNTALG